MEIVFYGKENCPKCENSKRVLDSRNIKYRFVLIGKDIARETFLNTFPNVKTVPFFVVEHNRVEDLNQQISVFSDVYELINYYGGPRNV